MTLLQYEWRKLARAPMLWIGLALCLGFNCLWMTSAGPQREIFDQSMQSDHTPENVFEGYDIGELTEFYCYWLGDSPAGKWMARKYEKLQPRAEHLAESGAALDFYAGPITESLHELLFGSLFRLILGEAAVLGMLAMLYLLGYEDIQRTTAAVCASRTGRRLYRAKVLAGLAAAGGGYVLLAAGTLGVYFSLWDYSDIWSSSISSGFNRLTDMLYSRPVLTWADFTVGRYLAAELALGLVLIAVFALLAAVCGTLVRHTYLAALTLIVLCLGGLVAPSICGEAGFWTLYALFMFGPVLVLLNPGGWFTELGLNGFVPWQETVTAALWLGLLGVGLWLALGRSARKDVLT